MNKLVFALCLLMLCRHGAQAQDPTNYIRTDLIPASPNAGSIGKFGEIPINLSTGSAGMNIPIFNLQGRELSLPISLSYSYDGYKPTEPSSWVGLGWNLNAGGVISLTVKGLLDNANSSGYNYEDSYTQGKLADLRTIAVTPDQNFLGMIANGIIDAECDVYNFNFGGYSGKFIRYKGKFYCLPYQKFRISGDQVAGFTIVVDDGTKYEFTQTETTSAKSSAAAPYTLPTYTSSWYLTSITNAANTDAITLSYTTESQLLRQGTYTQSYKKLLSSGSSTPGTESSVLGAAKRTYPTYLIPARLTTITSSKYVVNFLPSAQNRKDLLFKNAGDTTALFLDSISVIGIGAEDPIKTFKLNHSFSTKILLFNSIFEYPGSGTAAAQKHLFEYEPVGVDIPYLAAVDHYGYAMGGEFGSILIPDIYYPGGPNRDPVFSATKSGALTKITYPTGGSSVFEYEQNVRYTNSSFLETPHNEGAESTRTLGDTNPLNSSASSTFVLNHAQTITVSVIREPFTENTDNEAKNLSNDFEIYDGSTTVASGKILYESENGNKTYTFPLSAGTYYFKSFCDLKEHQMNVYVSYTYLTTTPNVGAPTGGIRVRQVTNYTLAGPPLVKTYTYTREDGFPSGSYESLVYEGSQFTEKKPIPGTTYSTYDVLYSNITSAISESYYQGIPRYYSSVLETISSPTEKLSTRTNFQSFANYNLGIETKSVTQYKWTPGDVLVPINKKEFEYDLKRDTILFMAKPRMVESGGLDPVYEWEDVTYDQVWKYLKFTRNVTYEGTDSLVTVERHSYDINGSNNTYNLLVTTNTDAEGKVTISKYKHPDSYTSSLNGSFVAANVLTPVWEQQTWRKVGSDSVLLAAVFTKYSDTLFKPTKIYSLQQKNISALNAETKTGDRYNTLLSDSRFEERVNYSYNSTGQLLRQQLKYGMPTAYKWVNDNVVAEVKNATENEFYEESFAYEQPSVGTAHTGNSFHSGDLAVSWSIPNARTYVLSYWYRDSGTWKYHEQPYTDATTLTLGDAIDDVRIYPADAMLTTLNYKAGIGISAQTDAKGMTSYFEYDGFGRLLNVKNQHANIVKTYDYNTNTGGNFYYNAEKTGSFTKNNCSEGIGTVVYYTVPAATYSSATSQAAADALATTDVSTNGQSNANTNGSCAAATVFSFTNDTELVEEDGPHLAAITGIQFKDSGGNVLYSFNQTQVAAGFTVPQGTYTVSVTINDFSPSAQGWVYFLLTCGSNYYETTRTVDSVYNFTGAVLSTGTATVLISNGIYRKSNEN